MTPKQQLRAHLDEHHPRAAKTARSRKNASVGSRATLAELQKAHGLEHWRYACTHTHGPQKNLGPVHRPDGWFDGGHVLLRG